MVLCSETELLIVWQKKKRAKPQPSNAIAMNTVSLLICGGVKSKLRERLGRKGRVKIIAIWMPHVEEFNEIYLREVCFSSLSLSPKHRIRCNAFSALREEESMNGEYLDAI